MINWLYFAHAVAHPTGRIHVRSMFFSVGWNLILLTLGLFVLAICIKAIAIPRGFITGGTF